MVTKIEIILRMVTEIKQKLFFENEITTKIVVHPDWKRKLCVLAMCLIKIT